mmetsp:Transcript_7805/g.11010  ORF Transcript_7805/g.11010 Transcript_7805/m.11010 type:complete len:450 (-) Transcript_7805:411-1760(-)|eukprot:CAMPEP_0185574276 /NCGR_PEP_ID=MMETSP0434-20130131/5787_1 /TAXON_ID=626734 ORGANISM="Favella taraikaensis, Strain Fe Narragansett Bay" /NCGR_SAMPLE_ID=MMETSP0434 /ASSEMBLY_ACC=CAM_ASM_000379 /LENGTH=449 /DNA_ID=CAMNT_0028190797 /DNA_START=15 /DNA_END=1364 /DNA_ORIENTATION=-
MAQLQTTPSTTRAAFLFTIKAIIISFLFSTSFHSKAQTYVTLTNGAWMDNISVWSTNGGASACGCTPGTAPGAVTVIVNHTLTVAPDLDLSNATATINASGSMSGSFNLTIGNATMDIFGVVNLDRYTQNTGAVVTIHSGGTMVASDRLTLNGGSLTADAAVLTSGRVDIASGASLSILNGSKLNILTGNLRNAGTITLGATSCIETNGNIQNMATGVINGNGALNSGGNIVNSGVIDNTISWCANGAGVGMPTAEDCLTATGVCNAVVLPIELVSFTATLNEYKQAAIEWSTITELRNSHFILLKSTDGINWKEANYVDGAGTTSEQQFYMVLDEVSAGITYYMLAQYDFDGRENVYDPISVSSQSSDGWNVFPNPSNTNGELTISNLESGSGSILLTDMRGQQLVYETLNASNGQFQVPLSNMETGVYLLTIELNGSAKTERIVIQD